MLSLQVRWGGRVGLSVCLACSVDWMPEGMWDWGGRGPRPKGRLKGERGRKAAPSTPPYPSAPVGSFVDVDSGGGKVCSAAVVCVDPTRSPPCVDYKSWRWEGHWGGEGMPREREALVFGKGRERRDRRPRPMESALRPSSIPCLSGERVGVSECVNVLGREGWAGTNGDGGGVKVAVSLSQRLLKRKECLSPLDARSRLRSPQRPMDGLSCGEVTEY